MIGLGGGLGVGGDSAGRCAGSLGGESVGSRGGREV